MGIRAQDTADYLVSKHLYTYADGLPAGEVICAAEDQLGYMWFGTRNGLCRFDGKNFLVFTVKKSGLYSNHISSIIPDCSHGLIIAYGTRDNVYSATYTHVEVIDVNTLIVSSFNKYYPACPFSSDDIVSLNPNPEGKSGVEMFMSPFHFYKLETFRHINTWILDSSGFRQTTLSLTSGVTMNVNLPIPKLQITYFTDSSQFNDKTFLILGKNRVHPHLGGSRIFEDAGGTLLSIPDSNRNFHLYYVAKTGEVSAIDYPENSYAGIRFSPDYDYSPPCHGNIGIGVTRRNNFFNLLVAGAGYIPVTDSGDTEALRRARLLFNYSDRRGQIWLCTTEGIIKVILRKRKFNSYFTSSQAPFWSNHSARGLAIDRDVIYAAVGDFLCIKERTDVTYTPVNGVYALEKRSNKVIAGNTGLTTVNLSEKSTSFTGKLNIGDIWSIGRLDATKLLLGGTPGLYVYDELTGSTRAIREGAYSKPSLVYRVFRNSGSELMAVADNGIFILDDSGDVVDCYSAATKASLPFEHINDCREDEAEPGVFWIATAGEGLYRWRRRANKFEHFGVDDGFLSETMYRIEQDALGNLWVSTEFGIARFNKQTRSAKTYTKADGIAHNECNRASSTRGNDGRIAFGGIDGITVFNPPDFDGDQAILSYPFVVNSVKQYNNRTNTEVDITAEVLRGGTIELTNSCRNVSMRVMLLDFEERTHLYQYRVKGYDSAWRNCQDGLVELNGLPYGQFSLLVRAQTPAGTWNPVQIQVQLHVVRPFYATWWFILLSGLAVASIVVVIVKMRTRSIQQEKQNLEQTVRERTAELNASLGEQTALLQELHHRVKNNLQMISSLISLQTNASKDATEIHSLNDASRRIRAVALVHEMLYKDDKATGVEIKKYLGELVTTINELINVERLPVKFVVDAEEQVLKAETAVALGMITSELITNSLKYAFDQVPNPEILVFLRRGEEGKQVDFLVKDNGPGRSEPSENDQTKFGTRLIDIFSRQIRGTYSFANENGFIFRLTFRI